MIRARYRRIVFFFARLLFSLVYWELFLPRIGSAALGSAQSILQAARLGDRLSQAGSAYGGCADQGRSIPLFTRRRPAPRIYR